MAYLIHHFLENSADQKPDSEAVVHGKNRFSYREVEHMANKIANWLITQGIRKGQRIALLLRNSVSYIASYYGILKAGGVVVPLNTGLEADELKAMLVDCSPEIFISENHFSDTIQNIFSEKELYIRWLVMIEEQECAAPCEKISLTEIYQNNSGTRPVLKIIDQDLSSLIYTSGSTGKPKGAVLTHLNVVSNTKSISSYLELTHTDRCMVILPFYYVYGKTLLNTHFLVSGTVVIDNRFTFPNIILNTMLQERATGFAGVPSTFSILLNRSILKKMTFPDLRYITQAGGHMPLEVKDELLSHFFDKKIYIMYGATEASARLSYLEPEYLPMKKNSIGKAIPNVEIKVMKEDGKETVAYEIGEIAARGSNIMRGYWNKPDETSKVLKNGWYYTGDLGYADEEGFLFVTGRKRDMIKVGIYKVSALEIEEVLYKFPGLHEAAVIGIPDEVLGEALAAFVVMSHPENESDIISFCEKRLPQYKVPRKIVFTDTLPKNESGKIMKQKLLEPSSFKRQF